MGRGAERGWRCGALRAAIRSRAAEWIWFPAGRTLVLSRREPSACRVLMLPTDRKIHRLMVRGSSPQESVPPKRLPFERAQGNVHGNALAAGGGALPDRYRRVVADL